MPSLPPQKHYSMPTPHALPPTPPTKMASLPVTTASANAKSPAPVPAQPLPRQTRAAAAPQRKLSISPPAPAGPRRASYASMDSTVSRAASTDMHQQQAAQVQPGLPSRTQSQSLSFTAVSQAASADGHTHPGHAQFVPVPPQRRASQPLARDALARDAARRVTTELGHDTMGSREHAVLNEQARDEAMAMRAERERERRHQREGSGGSGRVASKRDLGHVVDLSQRVDHAPTHKPTRSDVGQHAPVNKAAHKPSLSLAHYATMPMPSTVVGPAPPPGAAPPVVPRPPRLATLAPSPPPRRQSVGTARGYSDNGYRALSVPGSPLAPAPANSPLNPSPTNTQARLVADRQQPRRSSSAQPPFDALELDAPRRDSLPAPMLTMRERARPTSQRGEKRLPSPPESGALAALIAAANPVARSVARPVPVPNVGLPGLTNSASIGSSISSLGEVSPSSSSGGSGEMRVRVRGITEVDSECDCGICVRERRKASLEMARKHHAIAIPNGAIMA